MTLTPQLTFMVLLVVQSVHLLHHRLARRHISFVEVISAALLCVPLSLPLPSWLFVAAHLAMIGIQVVGSVWIRKLSPSWS
jgi:hypothetical protein